MGKTILVSCPFCDGMVEVVADSGKVIRKWAAEEKSGPNSDRMADVLKKLSDDKNRRVDLFERKKDEMEKQKKKIDGIFRKEVDRVKEEGVDENPIRPFDLD